MYEYTTQTHLTDARVSKRQAWLDSHHRDNTYIKSLWLPSSCPLQNSYYDQSVGGQSLFNGRFRDTKNLSSKKESKMADLNDCGLYPYELLQGAYGSSELIVVENKAFRKEKKIDESHHYVRCRFSKKSGCKVRGIIDTDQENFRYTR